MYAKLNERAEAATGSYSVTGDSLQYIYSVPVTKNHRNIRSVFSWWIFLHRYIKEKFFVAASILYGYGTTYFYYEKLRRTMHTAIVSNLLKKLLLIFLSFHAMENLKYKLFLNSADQIKKLKNILLPNTLWEVNFVYRFDYCINVLLRFTRDMMDFLLILLIWCCCWY